MTITNRKSPLPRQISSSMEDRVFAPDRRSGNADVKGVPHALKNVSLQHRVPLIASLHPMASYLIGLLTPVRDFHYRAWNWQFATMRYELTEYEWSTIRPILPNKARGVPRVDDRRVLNGIFWVRDWRAMA